MCEYERACDLTPPRVRRRAATQVRSNCELEIALLSDPGDADFRRAIVRGRLLCAVALLSRGRRWVGVRVAWCLYCPQGLG
jgi:hypothetical protein